MVNQEEIIHLNHSNSFGHDYHTSKSTLPIIYVLLKISLHILKPHLVYDTNTLIQELPWERKNDITNEITVHQGP